MPHILRPIDTQKLADAILFLIFDRGGRVPGNELGGLVSEIYPVPHQFIHAAVNILLGNRILAYVLSHYEIDDGYFIKLHNSIASDNREYAEFHRLGEEYFLGEAS